MAVLGLNWSQMYALEKKEQETLLASGILVYSTITTSVCGKAINRIERRILVFCGKFYLMQLTSRPAYEPTGYWHIYGKEYSGLGYDRGALRRTSKENDAREDEIGERVFEHDNRKYGEPEVSWVTDSFRQMTLVERLAIRKFRRTYDKD